LGQNGPDCNDMAESVDPITEAKEKVGSGQLGWKMASRFMKKETRESVLTLYTWLRHVDDLIDEAPSIDEAMRNLEQSKLYVKEIFADAPSADPLLLAMQDLVKRHGIPQSFFSDFLIGRELHVRNVHCRSNLRLKSRTKVSTIVEKTFILDLPGFWSYLSTRGTSEKMRSCCRSPSSRSTMQLKPF
jgi:hypothetical protein